MAKIDPEITSILKRKFDFVMLTLEASRDEEIKLTPSIFLALSFCCLTDCQKLWY